MDRVRRMTGLLASSGISSRTLWLMLAIAVAVPLSGCGSRTKPAEAPTAEEAAKKADETVSEIEDQLRSALYQLQPENLNIDSRVDDAISVLNNWWAAIEAADLKPSGLAPAEIPADRISPELLARLQHDAFDGIDAQYIRGCYLARRISEQVAPSAASEIERVTEIFNWVCRNVGLRNPDDVAFPTGFYETVVTGRAEAEDRAVAVASILKQLRIDTAIISGVDSKDDSPWLLGVLLQDQVYLFDTNLGLPVPRGSESGWKAFESPATLAQIQEHPEWLKLLRVNDDEPYGLTADQLKKPRVQAVAFPNSWAPRIWVMEQLLPGENLCVLYDAPAKLDQLPGIFDRIARLFPDQKPADIGLWQYPLQVAERLQSPDAVTLRALQAALVPFIVPIEFDRDPDSGQVRRIETMRQLRIRTEQLFGHRNDAVAQYITIRQLSIQRPPEPSLGVVYQRAADDAFFWSCVCKFENGEYDSAEKQLSDYIKRYRRVGQWANEARLLLAQTLELAGKTDAALEMLRVQESGDPYRDRLAIMARMWSAPTTGKVPDGNEASSPAEAQSEKSDTPPPAQ